MFRGFGVVFCDTQNAPRTLEVLSKTGGDEEILNCINHTATFTRERNFIIQFEWLPSHIVIPFILRCLLLGLHTLKSSDKEELVEMTNLLRPESCSVRHYD